MPEAKDDVVAVDALDGRHCGCGNCSWFVRKLMGTVGQLVLLRGDYAGEVVPLYS